MYPNYGKNTVTVKRWLYENEFHEKTDINPSTIPEEDEDGEIIPVEPDENPTWTITCKVNEQQNQVKVGQELLVYRAKLFCDPDANILPNDEVTFNSITYKIMTIIPLYGIGGSCIRKTVYLE